ncbi:MAG: DNA polymerase III subunit delta' C-terminal domain-containing protein [Candidatus Dasytiphilus stammeri]
MVEEKTLIEGYPWLNHLYQKIIKQYQIARGYHALLINAADGLGLEALILKISNWLMCLYPINLNPCGNCQSCQLMRVGNHPDYYIFHLEIENNPLGIETIRNLCEKIYQRPLIARIKVICISKTEKLTEAAVNALLKTVEEPPDHTYFLLSSLETTSSLPVSLRSRCQLWQILPPDENQGLKWLIKHMKNNNNTQNGIAALRFSGGAPSAALKLLQSNSWPIRKKLYEKISDYLTGTVDIISILPLLHNENVTKQISWLCTLLLDALKLPYSGENLIINVDFYKLVSKLAQQFSVKILQISLRYWLVCRHNIQQQVISLNRELLLMEQLLDWEKLMISNLKIN